MVSVNEKDNGCLIDWSSPSIPSRDKPLIPVPTVSENILQSTTDDNPFDAIERQIVKNDPFDGFETHKHETIDIFGKTVNDMEICNSMLDKLTIKEFEYQRTDEDIKKLINISPSKLNTSKIELEDTAHYITKHIHDCVQHVLKDYTELFYNTVALKRKESTDVLVNIPSLHNNTDDINSNTTTDEINQGDKSEHYIMQLSKEQTAKYIKERVEYCIQKTLKKIEIDKEATSPNTNTLDELKLFSTVSPGVLENLKYNPRLLSDADFQFAINQNGLNMKTNTTPISNMEQTLSFPLAEAGRKLHYKMQLSSDDEITASADYETVMTNSLMNIEFPSNEVRNLTRDNIKSSLKSFPTSPSSLLSSPVSINRIKRSISFGEIPRTLNRPFRLITDDSAFSNKFSRLNDINGKVNSENSEENITSIVPYWVSADSSSDDNEDSTYFNEKQTNLYKRSMISSVSSNVNVRSYRTDNKLPRLPLHSTDFHIKKSEPSKTSVQRGGPMKALLPLQHMAKDQMCTQVSSNNTKRNSVHYEEVSVTPKLKNLKKIIKPVASSTPTMSNIPANSSLKVVSERRSVQNRSIFEKHANSSTRSSSVSHIRIPSPDSTSDRKINKTTSPISRYSREQQSTLKNIPRREPLNNRTQSISSYSRLSARSTTQNSTKNIRPVRSPSPLINSSSTNRRSLIKPRILQKEIKVRPVTFNRTRKGKENITPW